VERCCAIGVAQAQDPEHAWAVKGRSSVRGGRLRSPHTPRSGANQAGLAQPLTRPPTSGALSVAHTKRNAPPSPFLCYLLAIRSWPPATFVFGGPGLRLPAALASGRPADGSRCLRRSYDQPEPDGAFNLRSSPLIGLSAPGLSLNWKLKSSGILAGEPTSPRESLWHAPFSSVMPANCRDLYQGMTLPLP